MGMKTASSWLANKWTVTTSAFQKIISTIEFNVEKVVSNDIKELVVFKPKVTLNVFYNNKARRITGNAPKHNQVSRIRKHLSSIHRKFI